jgi:hypothetical protein
MFIGLLLLVSVVASFAVAHSSKKHLVVVEVVTNRFSRIAVPGNHTSGDVNYWTADLYDAKQKTIVGLMNGYCTYTNGQLKQQLCVSNFMLETGTLLTTGDGVCYPGSSANWGVTGGTAAYSHAQGQVSTVANATGSSLYTHTFSF